MASKIPSMDVLTAPLQQWLWRLLRGTKIPAVVAERHPDIARHVPGVVALTDPALDLTKPCSPRP